MKKYNFYIKNFSLFLTTELAIVLIFSLFNLFGMNTSISSLLIFLLNVLLFLTIGFVHGKHCNQKGYITGILTGLFLSVIMVLLNISFFKGNFNINLILYYLVLLTSSSLGAMIGKSRKVDTSE